MIKILDWRINKFVCMKKKIGKNVEIYMYVSVFLLK